MSCTQLNYFKWIKSGCPQHCVKSVRIRSFSFPYFPALRLNMEIYSKSSYSVQKRGKTKHYLHNINQKENSKIIPQPIVFSGPSSFSGPYFRSFGLNTEILSVNLYILSKCGKKRTRKIPNTDTIYTTLIRAFFSSIWITQQLRSVGISLQKYETEQKWSFPLRISLVNVTKSAVSCGFGHIY